MNRGSLTGGPKQNLTSTPPKKRRAHSRPRRHKRDERPESWELSAGLVGALPKLQRDVRELTELVGLNLGRGRVTRDADVRTPGSRRKTTETRGVDPSRCLFCRGEIPLDKGNAQLCVCMSFIVPA